jgi:anti-sigma factor RsiW
VNHFDQHIGERELQALVPWSFDEGHEQPDLSAEAVREAELHVRSCPDCAQKVAQYRTIVDTSLKAASGSAPEGADCPRDVDWHEVAAGLWPELKAQQLIMHAALCPHCGPLLRAATSVEPQPTPQEESFLAQLAAPTRPVLPSASPLPTTVPVLAPVWGFMKWLVPAALVLVIGAIIFISARKPISGASYAEIAASTHQQHAQGALALDFRSDSQQQLNEWLKVKLPFALALPAAPEVPGENRPYRLEGARLVQVSGKPAVYISYLAPGDPVSLLVTPDSVAASSGGVTVDYKKVSFHYRMVGDTKVVTWSLKGRTYALVSHEGNRTQRSCMICHSAMGDRDLTTTPTPLGERISALRRVFQ